MHLVYLEDKVGTIYPISIFHDREFSRTEFRVLRLRPNQHPFGGSGRDTFLLCLHMVNMKGSSKEARDAKVRQAGVIARLNYEGDDRSELEKSFLRRAPAGLEWYFRHMDAFLYGFVRYCKFLEQTNGTAECSFDRFLGTNVVHSMRYAVYTTGS